MAIAGLVILLQLRYLCSVKTPLPLQDDWNFLDKMFRAADTRRLITWVFDSPNGHFMVPAALGYLLSWRYFSLDLTWLRLLSFPICLASFLLTAHVIAGQIKGRFLRCYLYTGACFVIFSLCFWEHFAQANGFSAMLSALFGGVSIYYVAKASQRPVPWKTRPFLAGLLFLLASTLSLGAGYAAVAAALSLLGFRTLKRVALSRRVPAYNAVMAAVFGALGLLAIFSHPFFYLKSRIVKAAFHAVLVAGSTGSAFLDKESVVAQNAAFGCGILLILTALSIAFHFLVKQSYDIRLIPVFAMGLVLFGFFGCLAAAIARAYLPNAEFISSRYTLYPSIMLLGALLYFGAYRILLLAHLWCFAAAVYLLATVEEFQMAFFRTELHQRMSNAITTVDIRTDDDLRADLYWRENIKGVRRVITRLRRDELNLFRGRYNDY